MGKIIFLLLIFLFIPNIVLAWGDCPFGMINDPAPGSCGRFIDTDRDGFCDNSQLAPEKRTKEEVIDVLQNKDTLQRRKVGYHLFSITVVAIFLYILTFILAKKNIITISEHRKIWNILLLTMFFISGILGLFLVIRVNYKIDIPLPFNLLFWHVEASIAMTVIAIFHFLWHWPYFKSIIKLKNKIC